MPNRIIKESICTSKNLNQLSAEEEVFFYRLIVNADDFGRFDAEPEILRARCFPRRTSFITIEQVLNWLNALVKAELIALYEVDGDLYGYFVTWNDHQQKRAKHSKYPPPPSESNHLISFDIICNQTPSNVPENRESRIREYENRESNICASKAAREHLAGQDSDENVEANKVTATSEDKPSTKKSGPRSPFKSKRQEQLFDEFWEAYPKKRSKGRAERAWVKIKPDEQLFKAILDGLERAKTSVEWLKDDGQYIPYPSSWLNAKGWEDEFSGGDIDVQNNNSDRFRDLYQDGGTYEDDS